MTTDPANPNLSPTASAAAIGGPLPPLRLLLANGNGRGRRASLGFLLHTMVVAVLFLLPLLVTEQITGSLPWRTIVTIPIQKGSPNGSVTKTQPRPSRPRWIKPTDIGHPSLAFWNHPIKSSGTGPIQTAGLDSTLDRLGTEGGFDIGVSMTPPPQFVEQPFMPAPASQSPVRPGGRVREPKLLRRVEPAYPILAKQAGIQGTVVLEATLGVDGRVERIAVVSGHPLLVVAAQQAVAEWVYKPTYLNDRPVPVLLRVTVEFILRR